MLAMFAWYVVFAQVPFPGVLLRITPKLTTSNVYRINAHMKVDGGLGEAEFTVQQTESVTSIARPYIRWKVLGKVESVSASGVLKSMQDSVRNPLGLDYESVRDNRGNVLKAVVGGVEVKTTQTSNLVFPQELVRVGDSWTATIFGNGKNLKIRYTLSDLATRKGRQIATIKGNYASGQMVKNLRPLVFVVDVPSGTTLSASSVYEVEANGKKMTMGFDVQLIRSSPVLK